MSAEPRSLDTDDLAPWVEAAAQRARRDARIEAFEVRADVRENLRVVAHNGAVRTNVRNEVAGLGVRVFAGSGVAYAYVNEMDERAIAAIVERATESALVHGRGRWRSFKPTLASGRKAIHRPDVRGAPTEASLEEILDLVKRAEAGAREVSPSLSVQASFGARTSRVVGADSTGGWLELGGLTSTLLVQAVAKDGARFGDGTEWRGGERGVGDYEDRGGAEELGRITARNALEAMDAVPFKAGRHRALTDNHLSGLLAHESFGHLTEYDLVASGWSVLRGRQGEQLASEAVTVRDDPVVPGPWKQGVAVPYDDEGSAGRPLALLEKGVLKHWMHTRDSAASEGLAPTGNGRALDARFAPIVRMRNTYIEPGDVPLDEAFEMLGDGVYLIGARGGAPRSDGSFMFTAKRGYVVEKGEKKAPLRSVSIHGNVLDFLQGVEALTTDFEVHTNYFGGCGKWDQSFLHVGTGGPHVLVRDALVGGQAA